MRIVDLATRIGRAGSGGAWRSNHWHGNPAVHEIWHYSTLMLRWETDERGNIVGKVYTSTGHGSVSDQGAMNRLFRAIGLNLYFSRKGGAEIVATD